MPRTRTLLWAAFALACGIQLVGLYAPSVDQGTSIPGLDKVAHAGMFALVMATGVVAGLPIRVVATVLVVHAGISEVVQATLLPTRDGDVWDAVADLVGIALGAIAAVPFVRGRADRPRAPRAPTVVGQDGAHGGRLAR